MALSSAMLGAPFTVTTLRHLAEPLGQSAASVNQLVVVGGAVAGAWALGGRKPAQRRSITQQSLAALCSCISIGAAWVSKTHSPQSRLLLNDASSASLNICIFSQAVRLDVGKGKALGADARWHDTFGRYIPHAIVATSVAYLAARIDMDCSGSGLFIWDRNNHERPLLALAAHCSQPVLSAVVYPLMLKKMTSARAKQAHQSNRAAQAIVCAVYLLVVNNMVDVIRRATRNG